MRQLTGISGDRPWPPHLLQYLTQHGYTLNPWPKGEESQREALLSAEAFLLFVPLLHNDQYLAAENLWKHYLELHTPQLKLVCAGFRVGQSGNDLDLLDLPPDPVAFFESALPAGEYWWPTPSGGLDLNDKLRRFFAGHGNESMLALLNRLRMLLQLAHREVVDMGVPYEEVYQDLLAPASLSRKWAEWQSRWDNYANYFQMAPFAEVFDQITRILPPLARWMQEEGRDPDLLRQGKALAILDDIRSAFTKVEEIYVGKELSHLNR